MRRQKRHVEAAHKEARSQQQKTGRAQCQAHGITRAYGLNAWYRHLHVVALKEERRWQREQHYARHHLHRITPPHADHQCTGNRRHHKLPKRTTRVDDTSGHAALVCR